MASASYAEDLTCSVCLSFFTDPVMLLCGHSFCRECINQALSSQHQCPQCRADIPEEGTLPTNHCLKSLVEKEKNRSKREQDDARELLISKADEWLCSEHEERLKLFCVTDQQLVCIICRDGEKHQGHKFKPVREAAAPLRTKLESRVQHIADDINDIERLAHAQREEMVKTKSDAQQLMTQISTQFEEMHQFLRRREEEIKNELRLKEEDAVEKMSDALNTMETVLSESKVALETVSSVLEITDSEQFIKSWSENNSMVTLEESFRARASKLQVVHASLSLGPYESHLQFFMWREMLQVVRPRAELLSLQSGTENMTVSDDGTNLMYYPDIIKAHCCKKQNYPNYHIYNGYRTDTCMVNPSECFASAFSSSEFTSGRHYWEIEVGEHVYWRVGLERHYLSYNKHAYVTSGREQLTLTAKPQKIGIYLDCTSNTLSFYDAGSMTHVHTMSTFTPAKAYFEYTCRPGENRNPLRVCRA